MKEFDDKKVELKENLIAELEEKKKMIENEKLTMELTGGRRITEKDKITKKSPPPHVGIKQNERKMKKNLTTL